MAGISIHPNPIREEMKRYLIKYSNGKFRQQEGINETFHYMIGIGIIDYIIDTEDGEIMFGDKDEAIHTEVIPSYHSSDLIIQNLKT